MTRSVLIVDDSPIDRRLAGRLIERQAGWSVIYANDGQQALDKVDEVDLVVTDMLMPQLNGLELVQKLRRSHPQLPVVLMTAHGSEDTAARALRHGAASYVPKRDLAMHLLSTLESVFDLASGDRAEQRVFAAISESTVRYELGHDSALFSPLVRHLEEMLTQFGLCDETGRIQVAVALREALMNALFHGNLEVSSDLKEEEGLEAFHQLAAERAAVAPYRDRRIQLVAKHTRDEAVYTVTDEGPGFDPSGLPDPTDPHNLERVHGRGLLLIRTFMDEVRHNAEGNEIVMLRRKQHPGDADADG